MGSRLGFKIFVGLLVTVPVITLFMIVGLERNYVEQLKEEHVASLEHSVHKRSPLEQRQDQDSMRFDRHEAPNPKRQDKMSLNAGKEPHFKSPSRAQVLSKSKPSISASTELVRTGPEFYELLKERKIHELRVEKSMRESWWYLKKRLRMIKTGQIPSGELDSYITSALDSVKDQYDAQRKWYSELNSVSSFEDPLQLNWQYWQRNISTEMHILMEKRLDRLQNPKDCDSARKLICQVGKTCGFGCQMHHVSYCFIVAYASERTLVLDSNGWSYNSKGWNSVFKPVSSCSASGTRKSWTLNSNEKTVTLPPIDNLSPRPPQLPMAVPSDIVDRLSSFHGFPFVWFASHFVHYLMRPSADLERYLGEKKEEMGLAGVEGPIIGVHVRRTDKRSEARYHELAEYMQHVDEWYDYYDLTHGETRVKRKVFIATDEPTVLREANEKYPNYQVFSDASITSLASRTSTRYSQESLYGVIFDVTMLSQCDYIVCTFSSQVCRLAFELMQRFHVDAANMYYSLDDVYYFGGQQAHNVEAIQDHNLEGREDEISFKVGDLIGIAGNEKNGFSVGKHAKTRKRGQFPSYKVEEHVLVADFPTYNEMDV